MAARRRLDEAREYGRKMQPIHDLEAAPSDLGTNAIFAVLDVDEIEGDAQPKKVTISGVADLVESYIVASPQHGVQYNLDNDLAASSNFIFTGSGIYASGVTSPSYTTNLSSINTVTATGYVLTNSDNGRTVVCNNASAIAVQVPAGLSSGFNCTVIQLASGQVTLTSGTSVLMDSAYAAFKTSAPYAVAGVIGIAADRYIVTGDITV